MSVSSKTPERCFNCNLDLSVQHAGTDTGNNVFDNIRLLKEISETLVNAAVNDGINSEKILFCSNCRPLISKYSHSKQLLLEATSPQSRIGRLIYSDDETTAYNVTNIKYNNEDTHTNIFASTETPVGYTILPDNEEDRGRPFTNKSEHQGDSNDSANNSTIKPEIELQEKFLRIQIEKLCETGNQVSAASVKDVFVEKVVSMFVCDECGRQFLESRLFDNHRRLAHTPIEFKYPCQFCNKSFSAEWFFKNHLRVSHNGLQILSSCQLCDKTFYSESEMQKHMLKDHDFRKYAFKCNHCIESFKEVSVLRKHLIQNHKGTKEAKYAATNIQMQERSRDVRVCTFCGEKFAKFSKIFTHMKAEHNYHLDAQCDVCNESFVSQEDMITHRRMHKDCLECDKTFDCYSRLKKHIEYSHNDEEATSHFCEICGASRSTSHKLYNHYAHHKYKFGPKHFCNICNKPLDSFHLLTTHIKNVHHGNPPKYKCPHCGKIFQIEMTFKLHLETFHQNKCLFPCEKCGKRFFTQPRLLKHDRMHRLLTPSKSEFEKTGKIEVSSCFSSETLLYNCPICERSCDSQPHFIRHLKLTHSVQGYTDPKNTKAITPSLKCPQCDKYFSRKDLLARHLRRNHSAQSAECVLKSFECSYCSKTLSNCVLSKFLAHVKRHEILIMQINAETKTKSEKQLAEFYDEQRNRFHCPACKTKFVNQSAFLKHFKQSGHSSEFRVVFIEDKKCQIKFQFQCPICPDRSFPNKAMLKRHNGTHVTKRNKENVCKVCLLACTSQRNLREHVSKLHTRRKKVKTNKKGKSKN